MIDVLPAQTRHLPALQQLVAEHLQLARFPFDHSADALRDRVARSLGSDGLFAERRRWIVWAALDGPRLVGAVRAYAVDRQPSQPAHQDDQVPAGIVWLLFDPARPDVGVRLLETALEWIGEDPEGIDGFDLAHGLGWGAGVPSMWQHVDEVLTHYGFASAGESYLMWGEAPPVFAGSVNPDVRLELAVGADDEWQFWAQLDGQRVGELLVKRMDAPTGWQPTWPGGRWIDWVHVNESHRRQGIASAMFAGLADHARQSGVRRLAGATRYTATIRLNERLGLVSRLVLRRYAGPATQRKPRLGGRRLTL
jgi:GNAT superfamily N-acetyltransferase